MWGFGGTATGNGNLKTPTDVAVDSNGIIYVSDSGNNRVLIYGSLVFLPVAGATPNGVVGQSTITGTAANWNTSDGLATAEGLYSPIGIYLDRQDTLYVGDAGNNRVVQFLKPAAVVNAATYQANVPVARGSLAALFGSALSGDTVTISSTTWPTTAANCQLVINEDLQASLYLCGTGAGEFPGACKCTVRRRENCGASGGYRRVGGGRQSAGGRSRTGYLPSNQWGTGQAAVVNQDGTINSTANPALIGSTILIYGTGQGQVSPAVADGTAAPRSPLANTVAVPTSSGTTCLNNQPSMCVAIGSTGFGDVKYSGLAPGYIGLWQINVVIPQGVSAGSVPVRVLINGTPSNTVTVAVR